MIKSIRKIIKKILKKFDLGIMRYSTIEKYRKCELILSYMDKIPDSKISKIYELLDKSKSQIFQDLFVLSELNFKKNGFFVEFGATNGINMSNSYILEKEFGWNGILVEPAKCWHNDLFNNRKCHVDTNCVWKDSNSILDFNEVKIPAYSTIIDYTQSDNNNRELNKSYQVNTISLNDLLDKYNAPKKIDYLSIDTEGSEFEILRNFDFTKYDINVITCEHNFTELRQKIYNLLKAKGYERKYTDFSRWDDWYIKLTN